MSQEFHDMLAGAIPAQIMLLLVSQDFAFLVKRHVVASPCTGHVMIRSCRQKGRKLVGSENVNVL